MKFVYLRTSYRTRSLTGGDTIIDECRTVVTNTSWINHTFLTIRVGRSVALGLVSTAVDAISTQSTLRDGLDAVVDAISWGAPVHTKPISSRNGQSKRLLLLNWLSFITSLIQGLRINEYFMVIALIGGQTLMLYLTYATVKIKFSCSKFLQCPECTQICSEKMLHKVEVNAI